MAHATFVTMDLLGAMQSSEIEAGLKGDFDAAARHLDRSEALIHAAVAQTPASIDQAIEQLRIAHWLAAYADCVLFREALTEALAVVEAEGLSGRALHLVRLAGAVPCEDPYAEQALQSFWRGAVARRVEPDIADETAPLRIN